MSDGIPIIYAGQEQHYNGGNDPYNREATWLSGYNTSSVLYKLIAQTKRYPLACHHQGLPVHYFQELSNLSR
jgi:hypothetical protein